MPPLVGLNPSLAFSATAGSRVDAVATGQLGLPNSVVPRQCSQRCTPAARQALHPSPAAQALLPPTCRDAHRHHVPGRRHAPCLILKVDGRVPVGVLSVQAAQVGDAVQRHAHADHELAGGDVDVGDPLGDGVLHLVVVVVVVVCVWGGGINGRTRGFG